MRDFRNAKAMAKTLREVLAERSFEINHSESLELIARILGCKNWQTLAAAIEAQAANLAEVGAQAPRPNPGKPGLVMPLVPMRDLVVLPGMMPPLFAGRAKTLRAIERATRGDQQLFLVGQKRPGDETPTLADLYEIGVTARVLHSVRMPDGETMRVVVQAERRARLTRLNDGELLEAEIETLDVPSPDDTSRALAREALECFRRFANLDDPAAPPVAMAHLSQLPRMVERPSAFADAITPQVANLAEAQALLEAADPADRLRRLIALMGEKRKAA
ncbi:MAG TPA: LON peptidase substrate-binding domain-containing protein [Caulobacteraceae bacterium]|nr:LON peptidase substrate-binding domain-containing protein [Caulobacteraceae bacterium]